jgi:acyl carrier protein
MTPNDIFNIIEQSFRQVCQSESINLDYKSTRNDIPQWTSLNHMIIIADIEKQMDITFNLQEAIDSSKDIKSLYDIVCKKCLINK